MLNQPIPMGTKDSSQIDQQLQALSESIQIAEGQIDQLTGKLQSVLSVELRAINNETKPQEVSSYFVPLALKINQSTSNVNELNGKLKSVIDRIQL